MPAYDAQRFSPPAPLAHVICKNLDTGAVLADVPMLLDTGADVSLLPQVVVNQLDLAAMPDRRYELVGFDGHVSTAPVVRTAIIFCGRTLRGQYLLIDQEYGVVGRNILNAVSLTLDGSRLAWSESGPR